jgi:hypothetical protein
MFKQRTDRCISTRVRERIDHLRLWFAVIGSQPGLIVAPIVGAKSIGTRFSWRSFQAQFGRSTKWRD